MVAMTPRTPSSSIALLDYLYRLHNGEDFLLPFHFLVLNPCEVVKATIGAIVFAVIGITRTAHRAGDDAFTAVRAGLHHQFSDQFHFFLAVGADFPADILDRIDKFLLCHIALCLS